MPEPRVHAGRHYAVQFFYAVPTVVPDEDPSLDPIVHVRTVQSIPYEIMRWFMDHVTDQVEHCHQGFEQAAAEAAE
ncbi:hypothetical protein [Lentzea californiensis]|uniref:hypothetical protein n=1 Tax=Lentzea californiensis TaxID=438851 RepID=UPI002164EB8C|nr:hypothetical protein [Lentzea californiensis]MCR3746125.1 hypothetical protein [Lentzea californiensis]